MCYAASNGQPTKVACFTPIESFRTLEKVSEEWESVLKSAGSRWGREMLAGTRRYGKGSDAASLQLVIRAMNMRLLQQL